jgi:hypothetical protein
MKVKMSWKLNSGNTRNMQRSLFGELLRKRILGGQRARKVNVKLREIHFENGRWTLMFQNCVRWRFLSLMVTVLEHIQPTEENV